MTSSISLPTYILFYKDVVSYSIGYVTRPPKKLMAEHFKETDHINKSVDNYNSVILGMERSNKGEYLLEHN